MGVGGDDSWSRSVYKDFLVPGGEYRWAMCVHPLERGEAADTAAQQALLSAPPWVKQLAADAAAAARAEKAARSRAGALPHPPARARSGSAGAAVPRARAGRDSSPFAATAANARRKRSSGPAEP